MLGAKSNPLIKRTLSAIFLFPIAVVILWMSGPYSDILVILCAIGLLGEWSRLCWQATFSKVHKLFWLLVGSIYILICSWSFWYLGIAYGWQIQVYLVVLASINDICAFAIGSWLKGPKLAPKITPNKTWAGAIGGLIGVVVMGVAATFMDVSIVGGLPSLVYIVGLHCLFSVAAQLGDLLESWAKRLFDVKDSSNLIPGRGGLLDRLDSLLAISLLASLLFLLNNPRI